MEQCCAFVKLKLRQCSLPVSIITDDNLHVCAKHTNYTLNDHERYNAKFIEKQKIDQIRKENKETNEKLLKEHVGDIPLHNKLGLIIKFALIDKDDYEKVKLYNWCRLNGYARSTIDGKDILMHHFITGKPKEDYVIHHMDHNGLNNKRENLKIVSISQNNQHKFKEEGKTSKYKGVYFEKRNDK